MQLATLCFVLPLTSLLGVGCFLNAGPISGEGEGGKSSTGSAGTAGAGGDQTGGSGGSSTSSTSATTTSSGSGTTTMAECQAPEDCPDFGYCSIRSCEQNECVQTPRPQGELVSGDNDGDCKLLQCDGKGMGETVADEDDPVDLDPTDCIEKKCSGMTLNVGQVANGTPCGAPPACHEQKCQNGQCPAATPIPGKTDYPDDNLNDCAYLECDNGVLYYIYGYNGVCPDNNPTNCYWPYCQDTGGQNYSCTGVYAPQNTPCKKQDNSNGFCNGLGTCQ
ncbi:MAG: hypothetical protein IPK82_09475 [Polyangiaceae bacterium]|nr:hypothetical protein [Polyangiaceae bacterium]